MRWLLPSLLLWCSGCPAPPCGPGTCDGCCSAEGECLHGVSQSECGLGGVACASCRASQLCTARGCRTPPDAGPRDGGEACGCAAGCCAADGRCTAGAAPDACGPPWTFCATCALGERCESYACTSAPCVGCIDSAGHCAGGAQDFACGADAGLCVACQPSQSCVAGACVANTCSAATCAGCCTATLACFATTDSGHCGIGGAPCLSCGVAQACVSGRCR